MYFTFYEGGKAFLSPPEGPNTLGVAVSGGLCGLLSWVLVSLFWFCGFAVLGGVYTGRVL